MTTTPHGQPPEALRQAAWLKKEGASCQRHYDLGVLIERQHAELETLRARVQELEAHLILDCMTHVQNPAEIEHVVGDVSKNVAEMNTAGTVLTHKQAVGSKNCMQCCVSYMLGLPLESVPDFATDGGWELFSEFVESKGYAAVMLPGNHEFEADYLASGTTDRGTSHMVVMNDGKLVHDPHPSNAGLVEVQCVWLLAKRATPRAVHADEQAAFEAVAKADTSNVSFIRDDTGYVDMTAALLWHGWKLRASHGQAPAQAAPQQEAQEPVAWYVTGCGRLLDGDEAKAEARHIGGTARAMPLYTAPQADSVTAPAGGVVAAGRFMDEAAERRSAQEGYENRIKRVSERNPHDEGMYSLGWWDRAWKAAAPTQPAQAAESVLEDAARLDWLLLHISGAEFRRIGVHYSGNASRADVDAARKQGANHD